MTHETPPNSPYMDAAEASSTPTECPGDLAELTASAARLKLAHEDAESKAKALSKKLAETQETILKTLELMGLDTVRAHGFLFYTVMDSSVKTPKTTEAKKALFDFLESRGMFLEMVSVNSQTLNSLYKTLSEEAAKAGDLDFKLPGVEEPTPWPKLKMKRG